MTIISHVLLSVAYKITCRLTPHKYQPCIKAPLISFSKFNCCRIASQSSNEVPKGDHLFNSIEACPASLVSGSLKMMIFKRLCLKSFSLVVFKFDSVRHLTLFFNPYPSQHPTNSSYFRYISASFATVLQHHASLSKR